MQFFETKEFKKLNKKWSKILEDNDFEDAEKAPQLDMRTNAWETKDQTLTFYLKVDHFLTQHPKIPKRHAEIMHLYSDGLYSIEISKKVGRSYAYVRNIIYTYENLILKIQL